MRRQTAPAALLAPILKNVTRGGVAGFPVLSSLRSAHRWNSDISGGRSIAAPKSSRFVRQGAPSSSGSPANPLRDGSGGGSAASDVRLGFGTEGCTSQQFLSLIHRLRSQHKSDPTEAQRHQSLQLLHRFSLKRIQNMDGRVVVQLLELLVRLQPLCAKTSDLVLDSIAWLTLYGESSSTPSMVVTQCIRYLVLLDVEELIVPVLLQCKRCYALLESPQRAADASVVLLAGVLYGYVHHDGRTTSSPAELAAVAQRLAKKVKASSLDSASPTDIRLLLESFAYVHHKKPWLMMTQSPAKDDPRPATKEGLLYETQEYVLSILNEEKGASLTGSLTLLESMKLVCCCVALALPSSGTSGAADPSSSPSSTNMAAGQQEHQTGIWSLVVRRTHELLEGFRDGNPLISSSLVLPLQALIEDTQKINRVKPTGVSAALITLAESCLKHYVEHPSADPDVLVSLLRFHLEKEKRKCCHCAHLPPADPLSLLIGAAMTVPTGCTPILSPEAALAPQISPVAAVPSSLIEAVERSCEQYGLPAAPPAGSPPTAASSASTTAFLWSALSVETLVEYFLLTDSIIDGEKKEEQPLEAVVEGEGESAAVGTQPHLPAKLPPRAAQLHQRYFERLSQVYRKFPDQVVPSDFAPFFTAQMDHAEYFSEVVQMASDRIPSWSVHQVLHWMRLTVHASASSAAVRTMIRAACGALAPLMSRASSEQLVALMYYVGSAGVRNEEFCKAVEARLGKLCEEAESRPGEEGAHGKLTVIGLSIILAGLAGVEFHSTKPFLDAAPIIVEGLKRYAREREEEVEERKVCDGVRVSGSEEGLPLHASALADACVALLAGYSKMLVWNFQVIWSLADALTTSSLSERLTLRQLTVVQLALLRMDVYHAAGTDLFIQRLKQWAESIVAGDCAGSPPVLPMDSTILLSVWARVMAGVRLPPTSRQSSNESEPASIIMEAFERIIEAHLHDFNPLQQAELLLSLGRLEGRHRRRSSAYATQPPPTSCSTSAVATTPGLSQAFERLTTELIHTLPETSPLALSHIVRAYALAGRPPHAELFALVSQRLIRSKHEIAATTISSILSAFAATGYDDSVCFMEVIPRVRFVAQFGGPTDITNAAFAYASAKVWHYKLFSRLADRAIQLRSEYPPTHLVGLLRSYGLVGMRYDSLFTEMGPRIQAVAHLLTPEELGLVLESYSAVGILSPPVFACCAEEAVKRVDEFECASDAERLLGAMEEVGFVHRGVWLALHNKYPETVRGRFLGVQEKASVDASKGASMDAQPLGEEAEGNEASA